MIFILSSFVMASLLLVFIPPALAQQDLPPVLIPYNFAHIEEPDLTDCNIEAHDACKVDCYDIPIDEDYEHEQFFGCIDACNDYIIGCPDDYFSSKKYITMLGNVPKIIKDTPVKIELFGDGSSNWIIEVYPNSEGFFTHEFWARGDSCSGGVNFTIITTYSGLKDE